MAHSFTSPSHSKKTQTVHFRATLQIAEIAIVAKIRTLHQHNIELSINNLQKKRSYNTQGVTILVVLVLLVTDLWGIWSNLLGVYGIICWVYISELIYCNIVNSCNCSNI
ncbi:hypothetical protein AHAS_Ahas13G0261400 [Arachis hypogaea]